VFVEGTITPIRLRTLMPVSFSALPPW
jgi:hypothetical protein